MTGLENRRRLIRAVTVTALLALWAGSAAAQSPSPTLTSSGPATSASAIPGTSTAPSPTDDLTCTDLAGALPRSGFGWPLTWSVAEGGAEPIPGYPVAALASSLGITQADVCAVTFQYDVTTPGTIVRFRGAEPAGLLAAYVADAQAAAAANGTQLLAEPTDLSGRPATELLRDGWDRVAWQVADAIFEMPMGNGNTDAISALLPSIDGPLPHGTPPGPVPTENPNALASCSKAGDALPGNWQSAVGPDAIAGNSYNGDRASPAFMTYDLLDALGLGPWDICRIDFQVSDTTVSTGRFWRLGKGGAATLQPYLDDLTTTLQAAGATVTQATERMSKREVTTLTVTRPDGTATWYYLPSGKGFVEFQTRPEAERTVPLLPKAAKK